jgi:malonyl-ACP decarboxylase
MKQRVFITGTGIINSIADSTGDFQNSLQEGKQGFAFLPNQSGTAAPTIGAAIRDFSLEERLRKFGTLSAVPGEIVAGARQSARRAPLTIQLAVAAILEAYLQAQLFEAPLAKERIGIIVAGSNLTNSVQAGLYPKFAKDPEYLSPMYALQFMDTDHVGTLSEIFHIGGEGFTVGGASASGNVGIIKGFQSIRLGLADVCVIVGALADLTRMELQGFYNIGALGGKKFGGEPEKACRPFDREHEGFIYGQGCGCLILESLESVQKRRVAPLAEMLGGALVLDGNRLSNPDEAGEIKAMESALRQADVAAQEVDYINTHGTSSPLGDVTELKAIKGVFGRRIDRIWINATKGLTGHCLFAAGVVETIAAIIQMQGGFIHPNLNLENPIDPDFLFAGKTATAASLNTVMSNSFGFGGINTSIILRREA